MPKNRRKSSLKSIEKNTKVMADYAQFNLMASKVGLILGASIFIAIILIALLSGTRFG